MGPDLGRAAFIVAALVVLGWFAIGTQVNVRRGHRLLRWLEGGLPLLGEKTTLRWLGSSAVELKVAVAREPLRSAEVFIVLEPRDLPILWWLFRARGRRDLLIVRGELRTTPGVELEALDPRAWSTRGLERTAQRNRWSALSVPSGSPLVAYARGRADLAAALLPLAVVPELALVRLAVHHGTPNLEVQWQLAGLDTLAARRVLEVLHQLAARV
ncbi:MAG TPA: hypothetical protein VEU74_13145 [Gemmatimonadales bacterium]|nr:hypothetical protein [Gemmatimonadales bacterium]